MSVYWHHHIYHIVTHMGLCTYYWAVLCHHHRKKLLPKPADLSYYNWETQLSTSNSTPHYQVLYFVVIIAVMVM